MLACGTLCRCVNKHSFALLEISSTLSPSSKKTKHAKQQQQTIFVCLWQHSVLGNGWRWGLETKEWKRKAAAVPFCFFSSLIGERASVSGPTWWSELLVWPGQMRAPALMNHAAGNRSAAELHIMGAGPLHESLIGRGATEVLRPQTINQRQFCHYYSRELRHCTSWTFSPPCGMCPYFLHQLQVPSSLLFINHPISSFVKCTILQPIMNWISYKTSVSFVQPKEAVLPWLKLGTAHSLVIGSLHKAPCSSPQGKNKIITLMIKIWKKIYIKHL